MPPAFDAKKPNPALWIGLGVVVVIAVIGIGAMLLTRKDTPAPVPTLALPSPTAIAPPPSIVPTEAASPIASPTKPPKLADARIDGFYDGNKYDFTFRSNCASGPCDGLALSGAQFAIPYRGKGVYKGTEKLRATCADGGMHVQAPLHAKLVFRPVDAEMVGDEFTATKVDIDLQITRKAFKKTVRTSPTTIGTLTCGAYHQGDHFVAVLVPS